MTGAGPATIGGPEHVLRDEELAQFTGTCLDGYDLDRRSVLLVLPDATRSCPLPQLMRILHAALAGRVSRLTAVIALGTHAPMDEPALAAHLGYEPDHVHETYPGLEVVNHAWWDPTTFADLGPIDAHRVRKLSEGRLDMDVQVHVNRLAVEHDVAIVVGPVFPHEVVGFSGGNKYFFPGISGQQVIDVSHWLGALITSADIIGTQGVTPVRALIDEAASRIPALRLALCVVVRSGSSDLHGVTFGTPEAAWEAAASISQEAHIRYLDAPVDRVVSVIPTRYRDMWTAAKGFYKLEPVVADGGEVIIYAPHVTELAAMHPEVERIGYHCRDYFVQQWDRFRDVPWGVLAHSTHVRGAGCYDTATRVERSRVTVTLATGVPEATVRAAGLEYLDPRGVDLDALASAPGTRVVPNAGEILHRLR
jgi:nickel-dependent lactate racemase